MTDATWIGTDSLLEGRKAAEWLNAYTTAKGIDAKDVNIVDIQGTIGSTAQIGRSKGLEEGVGEDLGSYVNLFGYNPKYGVSGRRIVGVRYEPQSFSKGLTRPEQTLPARVARR